jgi:hypothetical protein
VGANSSRAIAVSATTWSKLRGRAARRKAFSLANASSMGLKSGTVGREEPQLRADAFNGGPDLGLLVHGQIVEHDDVARPQGWEQDLLDVGEKRRIVERTVADGGCPQAVDPQRRHDGVGLPMPTRCVIAQSQSVRARAIAPQQIGGHAGFVDEHVAARIVGRQGVLPPAPRGSHIRAPLFVSVYGFF